MRLGSITQGGRRQSARAGTDNNSLHSKRFVFFVAMVWLALIASPTSADTTDTTSWASASQLSGSWFDATK
ncbi:MAG TPA: hypothetical protein VIC53_00365, partial [Wenzhouxiangella sp.]